MIEIPPVRTGSSAEIPALTCHVLDTGFCRIPENHLVTTGRHLRVPVHSIAVLLGHPTYGWSLFDTGYAPRILDATRSLPFRVYRWVTPMTVTARLAVVNQLERFGLRDEDIRRIILSHFHADHIGGLLDFPETSFVVGREAWNAVRELSGLKALSRGFLPSLIPSDFEQRAILVDDFSGLAIEPFGASFDIFNDGSALLVRLPGHARGQLGLIANTIMGRTFFAADSYYMPDSLRQRALPHRITRWFGVDDWQTLAETIHKIADFTLENPEVHIIPTHCPEAFRTYVARPE